MAGDLHTHTTFSDGALDIEELPFLAARAGLTHLAVSDHDSMLSVEYAYAHPVQEGVALIPATELTAFDERRGRSVHLLCYWPDPTAPLREFCALMAQRRNEAQDRSAELLEQRYPQFTRAAALRFSQRSHVLYKTHIMRLLYEYGYTDGIYKDLYHELFGRGPESVLFEPAYESVDTVLSIIRQVRGVCVLAHPSVYKSMDLAEELARAGRIDGVEIDHPRNTPEDKAALRRLAGECGLIVTGGTDFHGMHMVRPLPLGTGRTTDENLERLAKLAQQRKTDAQI